MPTQQQYRRRQSRPATLLTRINPDRQGNDSQNGEQEEEDSDLNTQGFNGGPSEPTEEEVEAGNEWGTQHLTRLGTPDRRFLENRALTEEDIGIVNYRRANSSRVVNGIHVTEDGTPDRRYKENRALTDEDIEILKAQLILQKHGIQKNEISPTAILARHASSDAVTQTRMEAQNQTKASGTRQRVEARPVQHKAVANGSRRR